MNRTRATGLVAALAATALAVTACGSNSSPVASGVNSATSSLAVTGASGSESITIGSADFPESVLLADIYGDALKAKGITVTQKPKIGSREVYIPALKDGSIDLVPEYSGNLLSYFDTTTKATSSADVYQALPAAIGSQLKVLDESQAQDKDSITVTAATAAKYHLTSISDLQSQAGSLTLGGPTTFTTRSYGIPGLKSTYGVTFGKFLTLDAGGPLTIAALKNGRVDAADVFTTDTSITANKFVVLADPKNLFAAQNVLPLIAAKKDTPAVASALNAVSAKLDTNSLLTLNAQVASGTDADQVAQTWLKAQGLS